MSDRSSLFRTRGKQLETMLNTGMKQTSTNRRQAQVASLKLKLELEDVDVVVIVGWSAAGKV